MKANGRSHEADLIGAREIERQLADTERIAHLGRWAIVV